MTQQSTVVPTWLRSLVAAAHGLEVGDLTTFAPPSDSQPRAASVLMLFGEGDLGAAAGGAAPTTAPAVQRDHRGGHVLLLERSHDLRSHAGQIAFPGGARDPGDADAVATALREAEEETGLDPRGVQVLATLPELWLPPSNFLVTPVLAWWRAPTPVHAVDPAETASVHTVGLAKLLDPAARATIRHPSGYLGPAFLTGDLMIWGFTAGLLSRVLAAAGWERPWDTERVIDRPPDVAATALRDLCLRQVQA